MEAIIDYRGKTPKKASSGIPLITAKVVKGGRIETPDEFIAVDDYDAWMRRGLPKAGDIVMTTEAPLGEVAQLGTERVALAQRIIALRGKKGLLDNDFLKFLMQSEDVQKQLRARATGTTVLGIKQTELRKVFLTLPPLPEQRAIAHILGTLDDKIELNRRMSETLETMARALFKSWFVDFDPVRAKMEGRWQRGQSLPGLPAHLYDLFPDRLVDSELGEIPEGWGVKSIGDLAEVVGGSTPKTECAEFWDGGTHHWVTPKDLSGLSMPVLLDTERKITDAGLAQISSGLLPRGTVLLSSRAPIGYLAIAEVPVAVNQGFIAMKPRQGVSNLFLLRWARAAHDEILSHANGSTFLEISKASFRPIRVVTPPTPIMDAFDQFSRPMYGKVVENALESRTLAALRDALLPKLISGEIRVKDAERFLQERGL
ncbi:MAG: restriction endonuclease subunit S [Meiothermus ruber]|uniref:restriction endonuclease subunit S n=1 Tax=Meiothermus ruber TaxID=277 RepID=UPI0023F7C4BE|nr:restriction endonuclease subunit S [Meiothermus ruber]MCL6531176.1 restriction endonuclease subunit S [Meiothermus ruber]